MITRDSPRGPKITMIGEEGMEEIYYDELPHTTDAADPKDYFAPVMLSGRALDRVSQIVGEKYYKEKGIHTWLSERANYVFKKMPVSSTRAQFRSLEYTFSYHADGPVLEDVREMP
jgi:hypothetical protein